MTSPDLDQQIRAELDRICPPSFMPESALPHRPGHRHPPHPHHRRPTMSDYTTNLRTILDLIDTHQLPHTWIGCGLGSANYVDIDVLHAADIDQWAGQLGWNDYLDDNNHPKTRGTYQGIEVAVNSREERPPLPGGEAKAEVEDAEVGSA